MAMAHRRFRGAGVVAARMKAVAAAAVCLLFATVLFAAPLGFAWADEQLPADLEAMEGSDSQEEAPVDAGTDASPENMVNPQQLPDSSFIYDTSISDLESADTYLDKQTVQITGEVVGDRIWAEFDTDHCWILMQAIDGSHASVSVFMPTAESEVIDTYGAYGKKGTVLQVRGTFNLACSEHEGLSDLHASQVTFVSKGEVTPDEFDMASMVPGIVLVAIGLVLVAVFYRLRESQR